MIRLLSFISLTCAGQSLDAIGLGQLRNGLHRMNNKHSETFSEGCLGETAYNERAPLPRSFRLCSPHVSAPRLGRPIRLRTRCKKSGRRAVFFLRPSGSGTSAAAMSRRGTLAQSLTSGASRGELPPALALASEGQAAFLSRPQQKVECWPLQ